MKAHLNINNSLRIAEKKEQEDQQNLSKMMNSNTIKEQNVLCIIKLKKIIIKGSHIKWLSSLPYLKFS